MATEGLHKFTTIKLGFVVTTSYTLHCSTFASLWHFFHSRRGSPFLGANLLCAGVPIRTCSIYGSDIL